jgi:menaquinone-dependent protoporphyrinogen IX oxidase
MTKMKKVVVYKSKTGFTQKYAYWIAEDLHCEVINLEKFSISEADQYDIIIFGGGIHAGRINGIKFIQNNLSLLSNKKLIVFATGATPPIDKEVERFRQNNIPNTIDIAFFYFQSGMNYTRMGGTDKLLMGMLKAVLNAKKNKSDVEQGTIDAIQNSYDYSSQSQIEPLISYINAI